MVHYLQRYIFYPYNPVELPYISPEKDFSTIRIVHSPTNRIYKGTELICKVIEKLKRSYAFEFYLLENMSRDEVLKIKSTCTISIDQVGGKHGGTGYGKAGIPIKRKGKIPGTHSVIFQTAKETIELKHTAKSRDLFADGAINAAKWLANKKPGLYNMHDVLKIR